MHVHHKVEETPSQNMYHKVKTWDLPWENRKMKSFMSLGDLNKGCEMLSVSRFPENKVWFCFILFSSTQMKSVDHAQFMVHYHQWSIERLSFVFSLSIYTHLFPLLSLYSHLSSSHSTNIFSIYFVCMCVLVNVCMYF